MSFSLRAHYKFSKVTEISPEFLRSTGITLLLLDLDNTIAPYGKSVPDGEVADWAKSLQRSGVRLFFISNSRKSDRVTAFAEALGAQFLLRARKPSPRCLWIALVETGTEPENAAIAGDQIFTDTLAGNLAGVTTILIKPIALSNLLLALRYALEQPFRIISGWGVK